ncbi:MAG: SDR family oxidoreductase [Candidatus Omnitrophota bacterium]|nr:SDR family oxidoreductase [Candidatus Omnitrophota bacterium]MDZ4243109.1 SDR family oxidoreductase [Candidatus Omnitrophota bacterium]
MADYLTELFNLKGRTAVVIGGAGHLCSQMALGLAKCGVGIAVIDKDPDKIKEIIAKIEKTGAKAIGVTCDVTKKDELISARDQVLKVFGGVDILINGAGTNAPTPFFQITLEEWKSILDSHVTATFLACQVFGEVMVKRQKGSIINMSSASAGPPLSKAFTYSVAKSGVKNLTQNLGREWAKSNVRVNALRPGFFPTEWSMKNFIDKDRETAILGHTPMGRYGKPEELVGAVLWLSSDAASFVTGAEITVDGGFTGMTI